MSIHQLFAAKIRALRIRNGFTQMECADLAGLGRKSYRRLEAGQTKRIRLMTVKQLADVFGLKTWELLASLEKEEKDKTRSRTRCAVRKSEQGGWTAFHARVPIRCRRLAAKF